MIIFQTFLFQTYPYAARPTTKTLVTPTPFHFPLVFLFTKRDIYLLSTSNIGKCQLRLVYGTRLICRQHIWETSVTAYNCGYGCGYSVRRIPKETRFSFMLEWFHDIWEWDLFGLIPSYSPDNFQGKSAIFRVSHNQRCITIDSVIPAQSTAHSSNKRHRIELM